MKKNRIILITAWIINIIPILIMIFIPKDNNRYNLALIVFNLCIFVVPIILGAIEIIMHQKEDAFNEVRIQTIGGMLLILLPLIRFYQTVEDIAKPMLITVTITFFILEILIYIFSKQKHTFKQHIFMMIGTVVIVDLYYILAMIISIDFSVVW